jgi:thiol-disulfide isomerase/thioredoxin
MKTLFFIFTMLSACEPANVKLAEESTEGEKIIGAEDHTGSHGTSEEDLEPVGVIPASDCQHIDMGDKACNFRLADQNGDTWDLYRHKGDVIVIDFSTVWCPPCQAAGYYTQAIQDDYDSEGVQIVTILIDGAVGGVAPTEQEIDDWVKIHGITTAPVLEGSRDKIFDPTAVEGYSLGAFPTYLYLDRDMKFYGGHVGFSGDYIREKIEEGL